MTKTRVESSSSGRGGGIYRFKIWEIGAPEPTTWLLEGQENADDISSGSLLLVAHHVDVTFGRVAVVPPSQFAYSVKRTVSGSGSIILSPDLPVYANGTVVIATAHPVAGHSFSGWSGDLEGFNTTASFVVDGDMTITASFMSLSGGNTTGSDEFNAPSLDTGVWTFVDPFGDGTLAMTGSQLSLALPAGTDHDTWWPGGYNVARVAQSVVDEDFVIGTKFDSILTSRYQLQGIVIQEDEDSLLRFEFHHDGTTTRLYVASFDNTVPTVHMFKSIATTTKYMRVTRTGDYWVIAYSSDGIGWILGASFSLNMLVQAAGLYVGNHAAAHTSLIDYFHISTSHPANRAPVFTARLINGGGATEDESYSGSLTATDPDTGDTRTYTLESVPSWLAVAEDGTLSGTPDKSHVGLNRFTVRVTDAAGLFDAATLEITVASVPVGDFRDWLTENMLPADPTIDTDRDSICNMIEYIVDGDPANRNDLDLLPTAQMVLAAPAGDSSLSEYVLFTYRRSDRAARDPTLQIKVEWCNDLTDRWNNAGETDGVVTLPNDDPADKGVKLVSVYIPWSFEVRGKLFVRLGGIFTASE